MPMKTAEQFADDILNMVFDGETGFGLHSSASTENEMRKELQQYWRMSGINVEPLAKLLADMKAFADNAKSIEAAAVTYGWFSQLDAILYPSTTGEKKP